MMTSGYSIWQNRQHLSNRFDQQGHELAAVIAGISENGLIAQNQAILTQSLQGIKNHTNLAYVVIYSKDRQILLIKNLQQLALLPLPRQTDFDAALSKTDEHYYQDLSGHQNYLDILAPVMGSTDSKLSGQLIGYIRLGMSRQNIAEEIHRFNLDTVVIVFYC